MANHPLEILKAARLLISREESWTKHVMARDELGRVVDSTEEGAVCWCSLGAIRAISDTDDEERAAVQCLQAVVDGEWPADFNDRVSHQDVLAAFDRAIARAGATC